MPLQLEVLQNRLSELKSRRPTGTTSIYTGGQWSLEMMALQIAISEHMLRG